MAKPSKTKNQEAAASPTFEGDMGSGYEDHPVLEGEDTYPVGDDDGSEASGNYEETEFADEIELPEGAAVPTEETIAQAATPAIDPESKAAKVAARKAAAEARKAAIRLCLCGCGTQISNKGKSVFAMGHDMKVKKAILDNLRGAQPNLFLGVNAASRAYALQKWSGYIVDAINRYIDAPMKKEFSTLSHYNKLNYLAQLDPGPVATA